MTHRFELRCTLDATPAEVFDASLRTDVHLDSMDGSDEEMLDGPAGGSLGLGDTVTWRARHFGIWWTMTSEITEYDRPTMFVDAQRSGPFRAYRHEHRFEPDGTGSTSMTDRVEFTAPLGPLGRLVERLVLGRHMERLIRTRNAFIVDRFRDDSDEATNARARTGYTSDMSNEEVADPQEPESGTDSRVEDWHGQSAQRDAELADELTAEHDEDVAEELFEQQSDEAEIQDARRGDSIDPDQGESAYHDDDSLR